MVNKNAVGRQGPEFEMCIERGKVREFARATQSKHPLYVDDDEPFVPPTFLTSVVFWQPPEAADIYRELDLDVRRGLHGEQEYVFFGPPPRAGTRVTAKTRVEEVYEKEGKRGGALTFFVTVTDFRNDRGDLVAQARSTGIETARPPSDGAA